MDTSLTLSGLANGATYSWQVRAVNAGGITYADGWEQAYSSCRTNHTVDYSVRRLNRRLAPRNPVRTPIWVEQWLAPPPLCAWAMTPPGSSTAACCHSPPPACPITPSSRKSHFNVRRQGIVGGGNPVTTFQGFMVDIKKGSFGTSALQTTDWQTAASKTLAPSAPPFGGWYSVQPDLRQGLHQQTATTARSDADPPALQAG